MIKVLLWIDAAVVFQAPANLRSRVSETYTVAIAFLR